jgi:L-threonylcarbamoyladenylate synthase
MYVLPASAQRFLPRTCGKTRLEALKESMDAQSQTVWPTRTPELFRRAVDRAAELLRRGEVVALPTETVYGLAVNALNATAVSRIFELKGRPAHNPIIVHVSDIAMAKACVREWPPMADKLSRAFWPGPLTVVLPRANTIPDIVTASGPTVGIRWPSHPLMHAVIKACGFPLAAPSANPSGQVSPTSAEHVLKFFGEEIPLIVDGGASQVGIESTVLDLTTYPPTILRPGIIHAESLVAVTGELSDAAEMPKALKSPGMLLKHYSPKAKLIVAEWSNEEDLRARLATLPERAHVIAHSRIPLNYPANRISIIPHDPEAYARAIYAELHRCDEAGAEVILVEAVPTSAQWKAIADRLRRAAA